MGTWRTRALYWILLPTIAAAAGMLGYYAYLSANRFATLGEQSIVESTLALVNEKVDRIEQQIIQADNAVFHIVDLSDPSALEAEWLPLAERISPSVRAVLVVDDGGNVISYASRSRGRAREDFHKVFIERILPDLQLETRRVGQLRHLHRTYAGRSYLISYKTVRFEGRRHYLIAYHETGYIVRETFPALFVTEEGKLRYNVVDEDNRRVYGPSLSRAGDYVVGRRFPTTLYNWRLQVAPKQAPQLRAQRRSGFVTEFALVGLSFAIILIGVGFLIYAAMKESRLNLARTEFIANASHELKTPLSIVRMFADLLLSKRVRTEERRQKYLEVIARESERLSTLIENVLDFSAIERGKQIYRMETGSLSTVVGNVVDTFRLRFEPGKAQIAIVEDENLEDFPFDHQTVFLAVMNLLDNAAKYSEKDKRIEIRLEKRRRHAVVRVRDYGIGIPSSEHRRVFDRFYRVRRDSTTRGSGIGLSLVKRIAEAHGGRAWAANADGGGALVSFSLHMRIEADPAGTGDDRGSA